MIALTRFLSASALSVMLGAAALANDPTTPSSQSSGSDASTGVGASAKNANSSPSDSGSTPIGVPTGIGNVAVSGGLVLLNPLPAGLQLSADVRNAVDLANALRVEFVKKQTVLRQAMITANQTAREQIRARLRDNREAFIEQQQEIRGDLRKKIAELKDQLKDHADALEQAQVEAKARVHGRKGD